MDDSRLTTHDSRQTKSIGIFDSGIGGLTVFSQIAKLLPYQNLIYLGDTARLPYGTKSKETIERFSWEDAQFLLQQDIQLMVAACNTVSALALPFLQKNLSIPILGVIEPAVEKALTLSKTSKIGVIGTRATIESKTYEKTFRVLNPSVQVWSSACPLFVPLVEENWMEEGESFSIAQKYLNPLIEHKIDTLILGCTHYPLLRTVIQKIMGPEIMLIDSAEATALECVKIIQDLEASPREIPQHQFFVTDEPTRFRRMGEKFLGYPIPEVKHADLSTIYNQRTTINEPHVLIVPVGRTAAFP
ncbi:MAG: glutamate racemase [Chlamydiae bacterium]|nr:glutamate racemase [Chlamydiota bacterium]MBI3265811.1 glutamate racemase [Chlamydiota bacterium]